MSIFKLTPTLFFTGVFGVLICITGLVRTHDTSWLFGVALSTAFLTWSIAEAILATRRDMQELRRKALDVQPYQTPAANGREPQAPKPLRQNPYFRAGIMGLPFCIVEWFWKHELVFLLGGGFFAGIFIPTLYEQWRWKRDQKSKFAQSL